MRKLYKWIRSVTLALCILITFAITGCSRSPIAEFEDNITIGQAPLVVEFVNKSKNADSFHWDFGDDTG